MSETETKPRVRVKAHGVPMAGYFASGSSPYLIGWNPSLREPQTDVYASWLKAAARGIELAQNSGFIAGIVGNSTGSIVGGGLMLSARPDGEALGWSADRTREISSQFERVFRAWARNPLACDAGGQLTFGQQQQVALASWFLYGEYAAMAPLFKRMPGHLNTKLMMFPPSRIVQETDESRGMYQGVHIDAYGMPTAYRISTKTSLGWKDRDYAARDADGRPLVIHGKEPSMASTRQVGPFTTVLNAARQYDQVFNAVVTKKLTQAVFAAALRTNMTGPGRMDGLMLPSDQEKLEDFLVGWGEAKNEFYDGAQIDLTKHGRIAQLFPGDELQFIESNGRGELQDQINEWLLREICQGAGVLYETGTGDFRGATYSSVRMGGAIEWLTVMRRRQNLIIPFCDSAYRMVLEEAIATGKIAYPGGVRAFRVEMDYAAVASWQGPARPQADDYKTAKAQEVRKNMGAATMAEIWAEYGMDWDDAMLQQKKENDRADELGLPLPHAPTDILETKDGQDLALNEPQNPDPADRRDRKNKTKPQDGVRNDNPTNPEPRNQGAEDPVAALDAELATDLNEGSDGED